MSWSDYLPSIVALVGIPATAVVTLWRDNRIRAKQETREDKIRAEQKAREDQLSKQRQDDWVSQQWWERKAATYSAVVESIWQIVESDRQDYDRAFIDVDHEENAPEVTAERVRVYQENRDQLRKVADIGSFVISEEVARLLSDYFVQTGKMGGIDDYYEYMNTHYKAVKALLRDVRVAALKDLGLHRDATTDSLQQSKGVEVSA